MSRRRKLAYALVALAWGWVFAVVWSGPGTHQFDFKTYYCAARVHELGQDPYVIANIRAVGGNPHLLGFYYPPAALQLLRPLGALDYTAAHRIWVLLKALAVVVLLIVWKREFLPRGDGLLLFAGALLLFNGAMLWDIKTGNITVFEQLFLWAGLAFLARGRATAFVACVVIASLAKLLPAAFLLLLFLPRLRSRANTLRFAAGVAALAAVTLGPFAANPEQLDTWLRGLFSQHPRLEFNPSILGITDEFAHLPGLEFASAGPAKWAVVVAYYAAFVVVSRAFLRRVLGGPSLSTAILMAALAYALLAPRLIVYSYAVAIVPVLALLVPAARHAPIGAVAVLAALSVGGLRIIPGEAGKFLSDASPLLLLWGAWLALVVLEKRGRLADAP